MSDYFETLIAADVCLRRYSRLDWLLVDCRFDLAEPGWGPGVYRESHIPGAYYAHLEEALSRAPTEADGRHPLPDWRSFAQRLSGWGLRPERQVVVYDQGSGAIAARLWWLLRAVGHRRVAVLDGGWAAWQDAGVPGSARLPAGHSLPVALAPGSGWVTTAAVLKNLRSSQFRLIDARSRERFAGRREPIDPVAGHIPGAVNFPFEDNLAPDGRFLPAADLRRRWLAGLAQVPAEDVVHMCGSGVTACHNLLSMEVAGLPGSRLYAGSWSEWIRDEGRPLATGEG